MERVQKFCDICGVQKEHNEIQSVVIPVRYENEFHIKDIDYETPDICYDCCRFIISNQNPYCNPGDFLEFISKYGFTSEYINEVRKRFIT